MLIDCSFFTSGPRFILNASMGSMPNPNAEEVCRSIAGHIAAHQELFLLRMLGDGMGERMQKYIAERDYSHIPEEPMEAVAEKLCEPFADYVFFQILRENANQATITGLVRLKSANEHVSPLRRQVTVWNSMVEKNRRFAAWARSSACPVAGITVSEQMLTKINTLNI